MQRHKVTITPNANGFGAHQLHVDGQDLSRGVRSLQMSLDPGDAPRIELEMGIVEVEQMEFETPHLYISDATRDALVALGWTPPAVDADPVAVVLPARPEMESIVTMFDKRYQIVGWDAYGRDVDGVSSITLRLAPASDRTS
ncbi:hypothetical protein ABT294_00660 [Nonomuraea sp. NPDC000554]|uniref:hypothetical protein n=1 Tax=Nonomuraea sp. NPDC000554 TaxID=3154259 RepID=UPI00333363A2